MFASKKSLTVSVLIVFLIFGLSVFGFAYSGGNGTSNDPYQIDTKADLIELSNSLDDWGRTFHPNLQYLIQFRFKPAGLE